MWNYEQILRKLKKKIVTKNICSLLEVFPQLIRNYSVKNKNSPSTPMKIIWHIMATILLE